MTITKLTRTDLAPDLEPYRALFAQAELSHPAPSLSGDLQPRLFYALEQLLCTPAVSSFMLVKAPEEPEYLQWLAAETRTLHEPAAPLHGVRYEVNGAHVTLAPAQRAEDNFASTAPVVAADWLEAEQLFGCVRQFNGEITLQRHGPSGQRRRAGAFTTHTTGTTATVGAPEKYGDPSTL